MTSRFLFILISAAALSVAWYFGVPMAASAVNCVPSTGGTEAIFLNCAFSGTPNGADNGGIIVNGGAILTVNAGQTIVWSIGSTFVVNGSVAINATGALQQTYVWMFDADGDGWVATAAQTAQDVSPGSGYVRRNTVRSLTTMDCDDSAYSATNTCGSEG